MPLSYRIRKVIAFILLVILALFLIDMTEQVKLLDLHEEIDPMLFAILWAWLGIILVRPSVEEVRKEQELKKIRRNSRKT